MTKKRLTKKQLYGYSYMKWDHLRYEFIKLPGGLCSFCYDIEKLSEEDTCNYCQIDKSLCNKHGEESLYSKITRAKRELSSLIYEMCEELSMRYFDEKQK